MNRRIAAFVLAALLICAAGCSKKPSAAETTVNKRIIGAWEHYQEIGEPRVYLVDTFNGIGKHVVNDGVHLSSTGLANWYQTLLDHAQKYELSE